MVDEDIDTGMGALTLSADTSIFLRGSGGTRTLAGSAVTLTGTLDSRVSGAGASANNIIITAATGDIAINGGIIATGNDGVAVSQRGGNGGALNFTAENGGIKIAGSVNTNGADGRENEFVGSNAMFAGNGGDGGAVMITAGGAIQIGNINANGGDGGRDVAETFSGGSGDGGSVTLQGASVIAGIINARRGTVGAFVPGSDGLAGDDGTDGQVVITATDGNLTLNGDVNTDGGAITLIARGATAAILNGGAPRTLTADTLSLTQTGAFDTAFAGPSGLFTLTVGSALNLATAADQTVHGWMISGNRSLSLTSTGTFIALLPTPIDVGTGDLTLTAPTISLGGVVSLLGGNVRLNGAVDGTALSNSFTITATGNITLNGAITLGGMGSRTITLIAGMGNTAGNIMVAGASQLSAETVNLTQDGVFAPDLLLTFIAGSLLNLTTTTTAAQAVHAWMIGDGRNLSLTSTGGAIMIGRDIEIGVGNLTLEGGTLVFSGAARILSGAAISLSGAATSEGALSITASGQLTLNDNIATVEGANNNLSISGNGITTADGVALTSGNDLTISGAITTAATNGNLTLDAAGAGTLTLGGNINLGTGTATLRAGSDTGFAATASSRITAATVVVLFRSVNLGSETQVTAIADGTITFVDADGTSVTPDYGFGAPGCGDAAEACEITRAGASLVVQPTLASDVSITIMASDTGAVLSFAGSEDITLTSPIISIIASSIDLGGRLLRLVDGSGGITINGNITGAGEIDATGRTLSFVGAPEISGATISITATLLQTVNSSGVATDGNLTIIATDGLTITTAINIGAGMLTLTAGAGGTGDITGTSTPRLTAGTVSLEQAGTFAATAMFDFGAATSLTLTTSATVPQAVHGWMFAVMDRDLSLTSARRLLVFGDINIGTGDLFLSGRSIDLPSSPNAVTFTGGAVELTGIVDGATNSNNFTITASGDITLNGDIDTDTGALTLSGTNIFLRGGGGARTLAGSAVMINGILDSRGSGDGASANNIIITAMTGDITITGDITTRGGNGSNGQPVGGDGGDGGNLTLTATSGNIMITGSITTTGGVGGVGRLVAGEGFSGGDGGNGGNLTLMAATSGNITITANINTDGGGSLTSGGIAASNGGDGGDVMIAGGGMVRIGDISANGENGHASTFVISASGNGGDGGGITLQGVSVMVGLINARGGNGSGSSGSDGAIGSATITATGGNLTLNGNINVGGGAITLIAGGAGAAILNGGVMRTLTAGTVSLTQAGAFDDDLFTIASATSLTLVATAAATDQTVYAWMVDGTNRALSLTTTGAITIGRDIATGTGNLTLVGGTLMLTAAATLSGADIALTGALTSADLALIITATGNLTINDNISLGAGRTHFDRRRWRDQQRQYHEWEQCAHTDGRHGEPHAGGHICRRSVRDRCFGHLIDP